MSRSVPAAWQAGLESGDISLVSWWKITRRDGVEIRGTENTRDLSITVSPDPFTISGTFSASRGMTASNQRTTSDLSVSNQEMSGALKSGIVFDDLSADDLEAGLFDKAMYTAGLVDFKQPNAGVMIQMRGTLGNIRRDSDGNWKCELRSLAQALSQVTGRSYGILCDEELGGPRCGVDLDGYTFPGVVMGVTSKRVFEALIDTGSPGVESPYFVAGVLTFTSGANTGYSREVASDTDLTDIELYEAFPNTIAEDDEFEIVAGCNKQNNIQVYADTDEPNTIPAEPPSVANGRVTGDCEVKFGNGVNFQGFPNKPGPDTLVRLRTPESKKSGGGGKK